jgi:LysM domain
MKKIIFVAGVMAGVLGRSASNAQDMSPATNATVGMTVAASAATNAAAVAEAQGVEEKFKQLAADIDSLRASNESLRNKLAGVQEGMQQIRAEQARLATNGISAEDLKPLAAKIEEVDKKRVDDKNVIADQVKQTALQLERLITDRPTAPTKPAPNSPPPANATVTATDGFTYTVGPGDIGTAIWSSFNSKFKEKGMKTITWKQFVDANPTVDWKRLQVGQVIVIPKPPQ